MSGEYVQRATGSDKDQLQKMIFLRVSRAALNLLDVPLLPPPKIEGEYVDQWVIRRMKAETCWAEVERDVVAGKLRVARLGELLEALRIADTVRMHLAEKAA